jgi:hypothetical protein
MIPVRTALRVMPAAWLAVAIAAFSAWYATLIWSPPGYGTAATAAASGAMPFIASFVAGTAAWEGSRLRRGDVWGGPWVRPGWRIAGASALWPVLAGLVAVAAATVTKQLTAAAGAPDGPIVAVMALDLVTYAAVGLAIGVLTPPALAIPLASCLALLWLAFVPAMYPVWLRHLTGMYRDCCGLGEAVAPAALVSSAAVDLALIAAAAVCCAVSTPRLARAGAALGILALGAFIGVRFATGLTFAPVQPRDGSQLTCATERGVHVCLWPEHVSASAQITEAIAGVRSRWLAAGIDAPTLITEGSGAPEPGTLRVRITNTSQDGVVLAMASAMLPPFPDCGHGTTGGLAFPYLRAWFAAAGGASDPALESLQAPGDDLNPDVLTVVGQLEKAPPAVSRAWVEQAEATAVRCDEFQPDLRVRP